MISSISFILSNDIDRIESAIRNCDDNIRSECLSIEVNKAKKSEYKQLIANLENKNKLTDNDKDAISLYKYEMKCCSSSINGIECKIQQYKSEKRDLENKLEEVKRNLY